jgi:hypothetical protein
MLQVLHVDVAYVAMVVHVCCKLLFPNVSVVFPHVCCKCVYLNVARVSHICCMRFLSRCCIYFAMVFQVFLGIFYKCFRRMLQVF